MDISGKHRARVTQRPGVCSASRSTEFGCASGKILFAHLDGLTVAELVLQQMLRPHAHAERTIMFPDGHAAHNDHTRQ